MPASRSVPSRRPCCWFRPPPRRSSAPNSMRRRWMRWPRPLPPPASRSTTSAAPRTIASKWPACSRSARRKLRRSAPEGSDMTAVKVSTTINGDPVDYVCEPDETLLDVLRNRLGLTGAKEGCSTGDCGACSVTIDGRLTCSCLVLGAEADGHEIGTIEGMAKGDKLHPLQKKFIEHAALQCGICTPGFLVAAKSLLDSNPKPTETEVRFALAGNLCRCTGYDKIVRAVMDTAAEMRRA